MPNFKTPLKTLSFLTIILTILCIGVLPNVQAQGAGKASQQEGIVREFEIVGNRAVSEPTILAQIKTLKGQPLSRKMLGEDIKRLYATGYFTDVQFEIESLEDGFVKVIIKLQEKNVLSKISFRGNRVFRTKKLLEGITLKEGDFLDPRILKEDVARIQDLYENKGFSSSTVEYDISTDPATNQAQLLITLVEGVRQRISRIIVEGNKNFPDKKIMKLMKTRRDTLFTSGFFKEEVFDEDMARIRAYYQREGFMDVVVESSMASGEKKGSLVITVAIDEGRQYHIEGVEIAGAVLFPVDALMKDVQLTEGAIYSKEGIHRDIAALQSFYFDRGYIFARVNAETALNTVTGRIQVKYSIEENELAYVNKIRITGNTKTKDIVIRRELRIDPGDKFDGSKISRSKERLYNLGFFEEVTFDTEATSVQNHEDLVVNVKEAKTGEMTFGAGFSSIDKVLGFVEIAQRNFDIKNWETFTGDGQDLRVRAQVGSVRREYEISFTEPWIFDRPILFGVDAYDRVRTKENSVGLGFDEERRGGALRLGKEFKEYLRGDMTYRLENVDISAVDDTATQALKNEEGSNLVSSLFTQVTYDTRNNKFNPSRGYIASYAVSLAGSIFGGDKDFVKNYASVAKFFPFFENNVLELQARAGIVNSFGQSDEVPIYERFFAGGTHTIRGFEERDVGPKDPNTQDPVGGEGFLVLNAEYTFPIIEVLKGALFIDAGNVWENASDFGSDELRVGTGIGFRLKTPIGPIRLDFGYPLNPEAEEQDVKVHFSMSRGF